MSIKTKSKYCNTIEMAAGDKDLGVKSARKQQVQIFDPDLISKLRKT